MKFEDFSRETQKLITDFANVKGISKEEVVKRFGQLYSGRGVSRHSQNVRVFS